MVTASMDHDQQLYATACTVICTRTKVGNRASGSSVRQLNQDHRSAPADGALSIASQIDDEGRHNEYPVVGQLLRQKN